MDRSRSLRTRAVTALLLMVGFYGFSLAIAGGLLWHNLVRPAEEVDLERMFGADFVRYRDGVSLWWPRKRRS